jgi:hypothetical protein
MESGNIWDLPLDIIRRVESGNESSDSITFQELLYQQIDYYFLQNEVMKRDYLRDRGVGISVSLSAK